MLPLGKKINASFIIVFVAFLSCNQSNIKSTSDSNTSDFKWIVGKWTNNTDSNAIFFENWSVNSFGNYNGVSYILSKKDTVFYESIQLNNSDSGIFYSVAVNNQNKAQAVHFKLVSTKNQTYIFENKKHDFPQSITYQYKAPDTLNAWIEGTVKGNLKKESFLMWRNH